MPAATPATWRSSLGRAGRVSHISRSVSPTSVRLMTLRVPATAASEDGGWPGAVPEVSPMSSLPTRVTMDVVMGVPAAGAPALLPSGAPPLVRRRSARLVAGVAGGVADHL